MTLKTKPTFSNQWYPVNLKKKGQKLGFTEHDSNVFLYLRSNNGGGLDDKAAEATPVDPQPTSTH